jgi:hypothetical protein
VFRAIKVLIFIFQGSDLLASAKEGRKMVSKHEISRTWHLLETSTQ